MTHSAKSGWLALGLAALLAVGGYYYWQSRTLSANQPGYKTVTVDRGDIAPSISANGTLNPVVLVSVGTQVSGTLKQLHTDYNARVKAGQVLAELDPALFEAQVGQSEANLANARATLALAEAKEKRARELVGKGFISKTQMDEARQALDSAQAQVALSRAQLERDRTNLRYSVIRAPISGVVVARNVDVGQTVAASFQTPTLFTIAGDLTRMQIDTSVAEADIGSLKPGLPVRFAVDAFPERQFPGAIKEIRLNPAIQQNVVTYNVVIAVANPDGVLLPGMTAHVHITMNQRQDVLRIPNAALRFKPPREEEEKPGRPAVAKQPRAGTTVYRLVEGQLKPVVIRTGVSDANYTEVLAGELKPGDQLVVKALTAPKKKGSSAFQMRMF